MIVNNTQPLFETILGIIFVIFGLIINALIVYKIVKEKIPIKESSYSAVLLVFGLIPGILILCFGLLLLFY